MKLQVGVLFMALLMVLASLAQATSEVEAQPMALRSGSEQRELVTGVTNSLDTCSCSQCRKWLRRARYKGKNRTDDVQDCVTFMIRKSVQRCKFKGKIERLCRKIQDFGFSVTEACRTTDGFC